MEKIPDEGGRASYVDEVIIELGSKYFSFTTQ